MRIAYYSSLGTHHGPGCRYGGAEISLSYLIDHAIREGHQVTLITDPGHILAERFAGRVKLCYPPTVPVFHGKDGAPEPTHRRAKRPPAPQRLAFRNLRLLLGEMRETLRLYRFFRGLRSRIDVFHSNYTGCEVNAIAARLAGFPLVLGSYRVLPDASPKGCSWARRLIEWLSVRSLHHGIAVSEATRAAWSQRTSLPQRRTTTIHNGIDLSAIEQVQPHQVAALRSQLGLADDAIVIGHVGRLHPMKGQSLLLNAFAQVAREVPQARLLIAGDGPLRSSLEDQARALGLCQRATLLGDRTDVPVLLGVFDIFAFPSVHTETFGLAVAEAMAAGVPCVGSDLSGIPEVIAHQETGLVVPVGDEAALAAALLTLVRDGQLRRRMGTAGRERSRRLFDKDRCVRQVSNMYNELRRLALAAVALQDKPGSACASGIA